MDTKKEIRILKRRKNGNSAANLKWNSPTMLFIHFVVFGSLWAMHKEIEDLFDIILFLLPPIIVYGVIFLQKKYAEIEKAKVYPDRLLLKKNNKNMTIEYKDIESVQRLKGPITGFKVTTKKKQSFYFTIYLERIDYIFEAIYKFSPDLIPTEDYKALKGKFVSSDHIQAIVDKPSWWKIPLYQVIALNAIIIPLAFSILLLIKQKDFLIIRSSFSFLFDNFYVLSLKILPLLLPMIVIYQKLIKTRSLKNTKEKDNKKRDFAFEKKVLLQTSIPVTIINIFMQLMMYSYNINLVSHILFEDDFSRFNILGKQKLWIDKRYQVNSKKFPLTTDDIVAYESPDLEITLVKIVGLPGETGKQIIPQGNVLVIFSSQKDEDEAKLIPLQQIIGKFSEQPPILGENLEYFFLFG